MAGTVLIEMKNVTKKFPGVKALDSVDFSVEQGEIHALVGENGAGKSTLVKILAGVYRYGTYEGDILIEGQEQQFRNVNDAERAGIVMIPQELVILPQLSVAENMFLNNLPARGLSMSWQELYLNTQEMLDELHINTKPATPMRRLSAGQQQLVLIAKALLKTPQILILDESAASLPKADAALLFRNMRRLKEQGITCIYITHKIAEVVEVADRVTVLRDGRLVLCDYVSDMTEKSIVGKMVGREISQMYPREEREIGGPMLEVRNLTLQHPQDEDRSVVNDASFLIREGEIVGLYGLIGAGRTEMSKGIFGAWQGKKRSGKVLVNGKLTHIREPRDAMSYGIGLLPEDRKRDGLITGKSVATNVTIATSESISSRGVINRFLEYEIVKKQVDALSIKTPTFYSLVDKLSGGNQQKVIVARWLAANSKILLLDEPTKGIDVGAKVEIFHLLNELARDGHAILFISSELPEVLGVADRILVMREGSLVGDFDWREATEQTVINLALGV